MALRSVARRLVNWSSHRVFRSRPLAQLLFGIRFVPVGPEHYYFDATTYVLARHLRRSLRREQRVLDLGTGTAAALGLTLWRHVGCAVVSADVNPKMVRMSRESVAANAAPIEVVESDLFAGVAGPFDVVTFNPPYVPTAEGERRAMTEATRSQWDGGPSGTAVIERFLAALAALPHPVEAHVGVNARHVSEEPMRRCIAAEPTLELRGVHRHWALPIVVYVVGKREAGILEGDSLSS